jgi:GT2 family glycosyltransferase
MTAAPLVSVLVSCCGQLEYTRLLVPGLLRHSRPPVELLFLDAGSLDGTAEFLAGVQTSANVRVEVVRAAADPALSAACRDLLGRACGDFLVVLNNDTVVPEHWLDQLVALAQMGPEIGLVGPTSNAASPPQDAGPLPYRLGSRRRPGAEEWAVDTGPVEAFARSWRERHRGQWAQAERLGGFCLLVKRAMLEQVGVPEGLGVFDTEEVCRRARAAGWVLACCRDLFVHHFATRTFAQGGPGG